VGIYWHYYVEEYCEEACVTAILDKTCCDLHIFLSTKGVTIKVFAVFEH
jgi:hypothetical protein